jgi:periplasmic protein TonB
MSSSDGSELRDRHPPSDGQPSALTSAYDDPMAKVLGLDSESSWGPARWLGYGLGGALAMCLAGAGAYALALFVSSTNPRSASAPQEIDVQEEAPAPPPPPPTAKPEEKPEAPRAVAHEAPPPPPAQAGKVLTRAPDPNEPVDLTNDTFVTGNADGYVGGVTAANGTSKTPVRELAPVEKPAPPAPARPAVDRSRPAALAGGLQWDCDFPDEANANQIDDAYVTIAVHVKSDGTVENVSVTSDPGHGFARMARTCAQAKHFDPACDRDGNPIEATKSFRIHFSR